MGYVIGFPSNSCEQPDAARVRNRVGHEKIVYEESAASKRTGRRPTRSRHCNARESGGNVGASGDFDLFVTDVDKNEHSNGEARGRAELRQ